MENNIYVEAAKKSSFYKHLFSSGVQTDWNEIPFTTKQQLREADPYELLGTSLSNVVTYHETSGTTGKPSSSWFSYSDIEVEAAVLNNSALAFTENDLILNRFPFAVALPAFLVYWAAQKVRAGFISADQWNEVAPIPRVLDIMEKTKPTVLTVGPTELMNLYYVAKKLNKPLPTERLRAIVVAGELVTPARKRYMEKCWGVPVYLFYGSTETGGIFVSCEEGHFHLTHPKITVEVVDEKGQPAGENVAGSCVISTAREGMPLLRYFNEDYIEIKPADSCSCGCSSPVLMHYGRKDDLLNIDGQEKSLYDIHEIVYSLSSVPFIWKLQQRDTELYFLAQYEEEVNIAAIQQELSTALGNEVTVEQTILVPTDSLIPNKPAGKFYYIEKLESTHI